MVNAKSTTERGTVTGRALRDPKKGATSCRIRETPDWATQENITGRPLIRAGILSLGLMGVERAQVVVSHDDQAARMIHKHNQRKARQLLKLRFYQREIYSKVKKKSIGRQKQIKRHGNNRNMSQIKNTKNASGLQTQPKKNWTPQNKLN